MSKPGTADFNNPARAMDTIGDHRTKLIMGAGHALSMKTNNLKYHLMRDLLQKKSLEEIMLLKERLVQNSAEKPVA
jgi:hypothetical protein